MDHGIESRELRRERGKPEQGVLKLNAFHESGSIVIQVGDDGGGLNRERILAKAVEKGLLAEGAELSEQEIYKLIFEPGFSTAEQVTNISGRGVGMDVVRRNIEALRGSIHIDSEPGLGTTISIRLPLTLAIIDGFLTGVGDAAYVVPLDLVEECIELPAEAATRDYLNLRGEVLPFLRLGEQFGQMRSSRRRQSVVVVRYAGQRAGLVVDELMGEFQTVIKPLGPVFSQLKGIAGSTILGSGDVALILDVPNLIARTTAPGFQRLAA
jgi:two-component system chemotaxis sensor kinase CheA